MMKTRRSSIGLEGGRNPGGTFSTRFSLQSFVRRVGKLSDSQKIAIERMGFGNLLQISYKMLSKNLLAELMDRWCCEKRAFVLVHGDIKITLMDVALILGLRVTGDPVVLREDEPFSDLEREYGAAIWNRKITIASIEERLDSIGEIVDDDFIRSFLLFIFGTLVFPNPNCKIDSRYLSFLQKLDKVCDFAWGVALLEDIITWLCKRKEMNVQYVGGCLFFLQIWSYEHIDIARPGLLDFPAMFPRSCRWGNSRSHQRQWFATKFKELENDKILWKLQLTAHESNSDIIKELLVAQGDREELPAQSCTVLLEVDSAGTRLKILDQWIAELENESEMDIVRVYGKEGECSNQLRTASNESVIQTDDVDVTTLDHVSEGQRAQIEPPSTLQDSFSIITISDDEEEEDMGREDHILLEKNTQLKNEIEELKKENRALKDLLLSRSTFEEQNSKLRKQVEDLRQENQLLILSSSSLVARLERLVFDEVNATEEHRAKSPAHDV